MLHIAYTCTRQIRPGDEQFIRFRIRTLLRAVWAADKEARHYTGACIPGDEAIARILHCEFNENVHTVVPANDSQVDPKYRQHCTTYEICPPGTDYTYRNSLLVAHGITHLIAFPDTPVEVIRSGTWQTVRMARRLGRKVILLPLHGR